MGKAWLRAAPAALAAFSGGASMGTLYAYANSAALPAKPEAGVMACEKVLYAIADEPTYSGMAMGALACCNRWSLLGLAVGTFGATNTEHDAVAYARNAWVNMRPAAKDAAQ
eukprot:TRINITY_DN6436_c0_g1_i1.p1 TRINITY_DN6436_c0_g1~~TRINITY_DN6436_c0_g1_i1.p1  ORF type:complete len:112 (+),score=25.08 TRINITY_DN6436_c0_g1_i1:63-398(+)